MTDYNPFSLSEKTILITGASSGIGQSTAIECSRMGARVILTGRNEQRLNDTFEKLKPGEHEIVPADLTNQDDIKRLVEKLPLLNGLVCNAGITIQKPIAYIQQRDLQLLFETNTFSSINLTRSIMRAKRIVRNGSLVFVSSMAAHYSTPANSAYAATKAAVESFSRSCAIEFASKGIRSNAILPGMIETPFTMSGTILNEELAVDRKRYLLNRYGRPEEVAWAIIYLLSDASAWVTNTSLHISGGGRSQF